MSQAITKIAEARAKLWEYRQLFNQIENDGMVRILDDIDSSLMDALRVNDSATEETLSVFMESIK